MADKAAMTCSGRHGRRVPFEEVTAADRMLTFSQCMRSDRAPNWPDPITDSEGRPSSLDTTGPVPPELPAFAGTNHEVEQCQDSLALRSQELRLAAGPWENDLPTFRPCGLDFRDRPISAPPGPLMTQ